MLNNLEGIEFDEVADNNGTSYTVFRNSLQPHYRTVAYDILKGYFALFLITASVIILDYHFHSYWWIIIPVSSVLIGYIAAYLALLFMKQDISIFILTKKNDKLAEFFFAFPLAYR